MPEVTMQSNMKSRIPKPNPSKIPRPFLSVPKQCAERGKSITITNRPGASIARPIVPTKKLSTSVARTVVPPLKSTAKTKPIATHNPLVLATKSVLPSRKVVAMVRKPVVSQRHLTVTRPVAMKNPTGISVTRPKAITNNLSVVKPGVTKKPLTVADPVGLAKNRQAHILKPASSNSLKIVASVANTGTSRGYLQSSSRATTTGKSNKTSIMSFPTANKPGAVNRKAKTDISRKCKDIPKVGKSALTGRAKALCEEKENIPIVPVKLSLQQNIEFEPSEFCRNLILNNRELSPSIMNRACGFKLPTSKNDRPSAYKRMFDAAGDPNEEAVKAIRNSDFKADYQRYSKIMQQRSSVTASGTPAIIGRYSAYKSIETNKDPYEEAKKNIMELRSQKAAQEKIPAEFPCKATSNNEKEMRSPAARLTEGRYSAYKSMGTIVDPFLEAMKSIMEMRSKKTAQKKVTFATMDMEFPCKVTSDVAVKEIKCPQQPAKEPAGEEKIIFNKQIEDFNTTIEAFNEEKSNSVLELHTKLDKLDHFQKAVSSLKYDLLNKDKKIEKLEEEINRLRNKSENELALAMKEQDGQADNHMARLTDISEKSEVSSARSSNCEMQSHTPSTELKLPFAASSPIVENMSCKPNLCPSTAIMPSVNQNAALAMNQLNADKVDRAVIKSNTEVCSTKRNLELPKSILKNPSKYFACRYFSPISGLKMIDDNQKSDVFLSPAMRLDFREHEIQENCSPHFDTELIHGKGKPNSINFTETKSDGKSFFVNSSLINNGKSYTHKFLTPVANSCHDPVAMRELKFSDSDIAIKHVSNCNRIQELNFKDLEEEDNEDFDPEFENLKSVALRPIPKDNATSFKQKFLLPAETISQHCTSSDSPISNGISNDNDQLCSKGTLYIGCNATPSQSTAIRTYSEISAVLKSKTRSRTHRTQERLFTPQPISINPHSRFMSEISPDFLKGRCDPDFTSMDCAPIQTPLVLRNIAKSEQEDDTPGSVRMKICFEEEPQQQTQITGRHISTKLISALPTRQAVFNVLANEEVHFLMKHRPQISLNCRIGNPLASILDEGDEMHFQPIE